jgi:hypothetical protein
MRTKLADLLIAGIWGNVCFAGTVCCANAPKIHHKPVNLPSPHLKAFGRNECVELQWTDSDVHLICFYVERSQSMGADFERVVTIPV